MMARLQSAGEKANSRDPTNTASIEKRMSPIQSYPMGDRPGQNPSDANGSVESAGQQPGHACSKRHVPQSGV